jgi:hypothetical protein
MMRRIDHRTVELSPAESIIHDEYEALLDEGYSIPMAASLIRQRHKGISFSFHAFLVGAD